MARRSFFAQIKIDFDTVDYTKVGIVEFYVDGRGTPNFNDFVRVILNTIEENISIDNYNSVYRPPVKRYMYTIYHSDYALYMTLEKPIDHWIVQELPDTSATKILFGGNK